MGFRKITIIIAMLIMLWGYSVNAETYTIIVHKSKQPIQFLIEKSTDNTMTITKHRDIIINKTGNLNFLRHNNDPELAVIEVESSLSIHDVCNQLNAKPEIALAEPNYKLELYNETLDPLSFKQGYLIEDDLFQLWSLQSKKEIMIAVIDTGIDLDHDDLRNAIYNNTQEIVNGEDDDGNGYIDDIHGYQWLDYLDNKLSNDPEDDHGHGTHMSGIIAGLNNQKGIVGIHPRATILPLKVFDSQGIGTQLEAALAIRYAVDQGASIINCSWGYMHKTTVLEEAINYALSNNVLVVAAVGNGGIKTVMYPAKFNGVVGVGSIDRDSNQLASFSNFGEALDLAISGRKIFSTTRNNTYTYLTGTSTSTAIISGILGRIISNNPFLSLDEYQTVLMESSPVVLPDNIRKPNIYSLLEAFDTKASIIKHSKTYGEAQHHTTILSDVRIAPNPIRDNEALIHFLSSEEGVEGIISIYNLEGILQKKQTFISQYNRNQIIIPVNTFNNGTYIYTVSILGNNEIHKGKCSILR